MKKRKKSIEKDYKMPHIYEDDLEEIIKILEEADFKEYKIRTKEYEYENIDEIPKDLVPVNDLFISAGPYLYFRLVFNKEFANLEIEEDTIKAKGLFKKVDEVISRRERKILWFFSNLGVYTSFTLTAIYLVIYILFKYSILNKSTFLIISIIILIIYIIWVPISFRVRFYNYSKIQFSKISDKKNFFVKNKEIILKIVVPIITLIIGALISKYFLN